MTIAEKLEVREHLGTLVGRSEEEEIFEQKLDAWVHHEIEYEELLKNMPIAYYDSPERRVIERVRRYLTKKIQRIQSTDGSKV